MSEEQEKSQVESLSATKKPKAAKKPKVDEVALLTEEVNNLKECLCALATFTGNRALVKKFNLEPYDYKAEELKRSK